MSHLVRIARRNEEARATLFEACAVGDLPRVKTLLAKDPRLVNAQYWYQFPIHMAVRARSR